VLNISQYQTESEVLLIRYFSYTQNVATHLNKTTNYEIRIQLFEL